MLSYYIVDIGYAANMFFILTVLLAYKRSRKTLPLAFVVSLAMYITLDFICLTKIPGIPMQVSFVIAGFFEMFATFGILCLFTKGHIWRNYTFLILGYVLINAVTSLLISFSNRLQEVFAAYLVNGDVPMDIAVIFALISAVSGFLVTFIMSRFIKKEYNGNGRIYMIFSLLYALVGSVQVLFKTSTVQENIESNSAGNVTKMVFVVICVSTFYVFGLLYYRYEKKALASENERLARYIQSNDARYQKLVEDNKKLTAVKTDIMGYAKDLEGHNKQVYKDELKNLAKDVSGLALTGNIVIDALIKESFDKAKTAGIRYELVPGNVSFGEDKLLNYATILENLLIVAKECAQGAKDKWVYLSFRQNGEMILMKTEFSKEKKEKLALATNVLQKQTDNMQRLKLIKSLSEVMCGTVNITSNDEEGSIGVLLNNS